MLAKRMIYYIAGYILLSLGVTLTLLSELGAGGWDALVQNLYKMTSITMGIWLFIIAVVLVLAASIIKRQFPDIKVMFVAFITGKFIDFWYYIVFDSMEFENIMGRLTILLLGLFIIAFGSAMIFVTHLPKNHTETFVFSIVDTFSFQYKSVKTIADTCALCLALAFGFILKDFSNLGLGTILSTFCMGAVTQSFMPFAGKGLNYFTGRRELSQ